MVPGPPHRLGGKRLCGKRLGGERLAAKGSAAGAQTSRRRSGSLFVVERADQPFGIKLLDQANLDGGAKPARSAS
jgi:hypothetical protein